MAYHCLSLFSTIAKLVVKAIPLQKSTQGEVNEWWHTRQHRLRAGCNTTDGLVWLIRKVRENGDKKKHTVILMIDVSAAFPNTSRTEILKTLRHTDPKII
jgi:hypothetical protein